VKLNVHGQLGGANLFKLEEKRRHCKEKTSRGKGWILTILPWGLDRHAHTGEKRGLEENGNGRGFQSGDEIIGKEEIQEKEEMRGERGKNP